MKARGPRVGRDIAGILSRLCTGTVFLTRSKAEWWRWASEMSGGSMAKRQCLMRDACHGADLGSFLRHCHRFVTAALSPMCQSLLCIPFAVMCYAEILACLQIP